MTGTSITQLVAFFSDGQFIRIGTATLAIFGLVFVTWWVYRSLSDRNLFTFLERHGNLPRPTIGDRVLYAIRYIALFPLYSFAGFLIIACSLFIATRPADLASQEQLLFIAISLIGTVRIAAYVSEHLAEDIAKIIPLSMVTVVILNPTIGYLTSVLPGVVAFVRLVPSFAKYLVFLAILEVCLRIAAWATGSAGFDPASDPQE